MHFSRFTFRKAFLSSCLVLPLYLGACGDDNSSSAEDPSIEDEEEDNLGGDEFRDSTITGSNYNSKTGSASIIKSEILDVKSGNSYKTVQFGPYTWMAENANYKVSRSSCYDGDYENCESNGRLYQSMNADQACPSGFKIPSEADYEYMLKFAKSVTDPAFGFDPQMSGSCETVNSELQCKGQGKESYLMTSDFDVFKVTSKGKAYFEEANFSAYYAVRCMKMSHFVETESQLPTCDSSTYKYLDDFFVASKGKNYYCNKKKWVKDDENSCLSSERGDKHYYKDTLFICRNNTWEYATMNDVDASCTKKNQWEVQKLNGQSYICDDSTWRKPTNIESSIGLCNNDSLKKMAVFVNKKESIDYICDSIGWRKAVLTDSIGKCTATNQWKKVINNDSTYICDDSTWRKPTTIEAAIGLCTPDSIAKMGTVKTKYDSTQYFCDTTGWRKAVLRDSIGKCTKERQWEEKVNYGKKYICKDSVWNKASTREDSIGFCTPIRYGKIDSLKSGSSYSSYFCDSTGWRSTVMVDFVGNCEASKFYTTIEYKGTTYACRATKKWETLSTTEKNLGICSPKISGKIDTVKSSGYSYICDSISWRTTNIYDYYGNCDSTKLYTTKDFNGITYGCTSPTKWEKLTHPTSEFGFCTPKLKGVLKTDSTGRDYICDSTWRQATKSEVLGLCDDDRDGFEKVHNSVKYGCVNEEWRQFTTLEKTLGLCYKGTKDKIGQVNSVDYICSDTGWTKFTITQALGNCTISIDYETAEYANKMYVCKNLRWTLMDSVELALGVCKKDDYKTSYKYKDNYYYCSDHSWKIAPANIVLEKCTSSLLGQVEVYRDTSYYCSANQTWQIYTDVDKALGVCGPKKQEGLFKYNGKNYGCTYTGVGSNKRYHWREENEIDKALGFCHATGLTWKQYNGKDYACNTSYSGWISDTFKEMYGTCSKSFPEKLGMTVGYNNKLFYCDTMITYASSFSSWHIVEPIDSLGGVCRKALDGDTVTYKDSSYYCGTKNNYYRWLPATKVTQFLGKCGLANDGKVAVYNGLHMECYDENWRRAPVDYVTITDSRDGNSYKTIKIGNQEWMAENLKFEVAGSWCGDNDNGCATYGRLYSWDMAIGLPKNPHPDSIVIADTSSVQGICPKGWRLPTRRDWDSLLTQCNVEDLQKNATGYDETHTDVCGFSSIPTGYMNVFFRNGIDYTEERDKIKYSTNNTAYWTAIQEKYYSRDTTAVALIFNDKSDSYVPNNWRLYDKTDGLPIRCIKQ